MNFNDYPLRDELGEGLHVYERTTGLSAHLLVESLIEKYLIKTGIIGSDDEDIVDFPFDLIPSNEDVTPVNKNNFKKFSHGKYFQIIYEDLDFGHHLRNSYEELIEKLSEQSYQKLVELSKNSVGNIPKYPTFLRKSLENPTYTIEEHNSLYSKRRLKKRRIGEQQTKIEMDGFSMGTFENDDTNLEMVVSYLSDIDDSELEELKSKLLGFKGKRRKCTVEWIKEHEGVS